MESVHVAQCHEPWNKGKLVGQKVPFKLREIWDIRVRLQMQRRRRELALVELGIDSKLRAWRFGEATRARRVPRRSRRCTGDRAAAEDTASRAVRDHAADPRSGGGLDQVRRSEVRGLPVPESSTCITASWRKAVRAHCRCLGEGDRSRSGGLWYAFDAPDQGVADLPAHKEPQSRSASPGHAKLESTVRYLGIGVDDALEIAGQTEVSIRGSRCRWRRLIAVISRPPAGGR